MAREFSRNQRLGNQILRTLSELLTFDSKDPRVKGVSLTAVELTRDLSVARVHFSLMDPEGDVEAATEGLAKATGFLRSRLGQAIQTRHTPELRFIHDDSAAQSVKISKLIDDAKTH